MTQVRAETPTDAAPCEGRFQTCRSGRPSLDCLVTMLLYAEEDVKKHKDKKAKKHKKEKKSKKDDEEKQLLKAAKKFLKNSKLTAA